MRLSFCTTCHGRLWQLRKTLPINLTFTQVGFIEIFIVIFNDDETEQYLIDHYRDYIVDGRLRYIVVNEPRLWNAGYVKNIAHLQAMGEIVFNLDADNYIDHELVTLLVSLNDSAIVTPSLQSVKHESGAVGRIGLTKDNFVKLDGYRTDVASHHDGDLVYRAIKMKLTVIQNTCLNSPIPNPFQVCVVGCGYLGLANAILLNDHHKALYDTRPIKVPDTITKYRLVNSIPDCPIYVVCLPTVSFENTLDTSLIENFVANIKHTATIIIRSTVPVGFCDELIRNYPQLDIIYIPEFFREKHFETDIHNPDRIVIAGDYSKNLFNFDVNKIQFVGFREAESIKLLSNAYLTMRLAFFSDVKKFATEEGLNFEQLLTGVTSDKRIGNSYNSEPFIPAGKCLPKDTVTIAATTKSRLLTVLTEYVVFDK